MREVFTVEELATMGLPLSPANRFGQIVYTGGQTSRDSSGEIVGVGDIRAQTRQALTNVGLALTAAGATFDDVIKTNVYMTNRDQYPGMNEAYAEFFPERFPARTGLVVAGLRHPDLMIEIEAIAILDRKKAESEGAAPPPIL